MIKVCKFGGTSMADAKAIRQVKNIVQSDPERRFIIVSAPGKRFKDDIKITDMLYRCYNEVVESGTCKETFKVIRQRFTEIVKDLELSLDIESVLDKTEKEINESKCADFAASRGEYLSAIIAADFFGYEFVDAADMIRFDSHGKLNQDYTDDKVMSRLNGVEKAVIPGFYGKNFQGQIKTFSRGGSDITGSIIARGTKAGLYENWTDVSGFLVCDPRIVDNPKVIKQITYKEVRELSYMGASVLHAEAITPVMKGRIPINIKNTFKPEDKGTMIVPNEQYVNDDNSIITGIAGKKNFTVLLIEKSMMNAEVGFIRRVLSVVEHYGLCVEHLPSGIDTLSIVLETDQLANGVLNDLVGEIRENVNPDYVHVIENISLIATVGHGMARRPGTAATLFTALANANINIRMIDQGSSELNIIIGVANSDYEKCIKAIYSAFNK
ncbi:MAG: aspartate kinase [Clostridiales bacterium]|nr:aspartate kinase [Clostridiales bacterium]MBQ3046725.1 aspartate kinase [Clostridia bacterium]